MNINDYIHNDKNCIDFALWLFNRQTYSEQKCGETIEENMIGYNSPDAKALSPMLNCLNEGIEFKERDIILWVNTHLRPRLIKYHKQYEIYDSKKTSNRTMAK